MKANHFKREAKIMALLFLGLLLLALVAGLMLPALIQYIKVDQCLDSGGAYNYETKTCVKE
jgi:hypothetical protein